jgi:heat shock protein HslJ
MESPFSKRSLQSELPMKAIFAALLAVSSLTGICLGLTACSHRAPEEEPELTAADIGPAPADLTGGQLMGTRWRLVSMGPAGAEQAITSNAARPAFVQFDPGDQRLAGSTGCNRFFGQYRLIGTAGFTVGNIGMTRMSCYGPTADRDRQVLKELQLARFYGVTSQQLIIATKDNQRLIFAPMAADVTATYRCDQGRLVNTSLSALTGHLSLRLPDGSQEDLTPQPASSEEDYANGLYRFAISGETADLYDLTLNQQMHCTRQH